MLDDDDNKLSADKLFQHIIVITYKTLGASTSSEAWKEQFHVSMIKEMQKFNKSEYEKIFKDYFPIIYENTIMDNKFR